MFCIQQKHKGIFNRKSLCLTFNSQYTNDVRYGLLYFGKKKKYCYNKVDALMIKTLRCTNY